jgi:hypothetical protein
MLAFKELHWAQLSEEKSSNVRGNTHGEEQQTGEKGSARHIARGWTLFRPSVR